VLFPKVTKQLGPVGWVWSWVMIIIILGRVGLVC